MRRTSPNCFLVDFVLQRLTRTGTSRVGDRNRVIGTAAIALFFGTSMNGAVMRCTLVVC